MRIPMSDKYPNAKEPPYAIICNVPTVTKEGVTKQVLVDRKKTTAMWWTTQEPQLVFKIGSRQLAEEIIERFKHNEPEIVSWRFAKKFLEDQNS